MPEQRILVLDPTASDPDAEHRALRGRGGLTVRVITECRGVLAGGVGGEWPSRL
ncbi:hypothetical protein ACWGRF_07870 [Streptomyces zhihengii]